MQQDIFDISGKNWKHIRRYIMEEEVLKEIMKGKRCYQRIVVRIFKELFISTYKSGVKEGFKWSNITVR